MSSPSAQKKKGPVDFIPVKEISEIKSFLRQGVKSFAPSTIWTKQQGTLITSHLSAYIEEGKYKSLYFWAPQDFDFYSFQRGLQGSGASHCYMNVALASAHLFFHSNFMEYDESEGLRFEVPSVVYKVQRRKDFRLPIPDGYLIRLDFPDPETPEITISRRIHDMSAGGLSILVDPDEESAYHEGLLLRGMAFRLRGRRILVDGEVRYCRPLLAHGRLKGMKVGIQFLGLGRKDFEFIKAFVLEESRKYFSRLY